MTYDFYADENDIAKILDFIFSETDLLLYELASKYGQAIKFYRNTADVLNDYNFYSSGDSSKEFQLWTPKFNGDLVIRKIELDPKYCKGHTFRYSTEGWGLIQLYFGVRKNDKLPSSHLGHQSEKRALLWQDTNSNLGEVKKWNWKEVESTAKKLKYQINNKMSIRKFNSYGVLQGADKYVEKPSLT
jgi:hypothetical protein